MEDKCLAVNWWNSMRYELVWTKTEFPTLLLMVKNADYLGWDRDDLCRYLSSDSNEPPEWVVNNENSLFIRENIAVFYEDDSGGLYEVFEAEDDAEAEEWSNQIKQVQLPNLETHGDPEFISDESHEPRTSKYLYDCTVEFHTTRICVLLDSDASEIEDILDEEEFAKLLSSNGGFIDEEPGHRGSADLEILAGCTACNPFDETSFSHATSSTLLAALTESLKLANLSKKNLDKIEELLINDIKQRDKQGTPYRYTKNQISECQSILEILFREFPEEFRNLKVLLASSI